jgi:hypothetical protein
MHNLRVGQRGCSHGQQRAAQAVAGSVSRDAAKFYPSDAALASWMAQADRGLTQVVCAWRDSCKGTPLGPHSH